MKEVKTAVCKPCGGKDLKLQIYDITLSDIIYVNFNTKKLEYKSGKRLKTINFYRHSLAEQPQFNCATCGMTTAKIEFTDGSETSDPTQFILDVYDIELPTPLVFSLVTFNKLKKSMEASRDKSVKEAVKKIKKELKANPDDINKIENALKKKKKVEHMVKPDWDISGITDLEKKVDDLIKRCPESPSENVWLRKPGGVIYSYREQLLNVRNEVRKTIPKLIHKKFEENYDKYKDGEILKLKTSMEEANKDLDKIYETVKTKIKTLKGMIEDRI